jgi:short-chain fatty acids transporter
MDASITLATPEREKEGLLARLALGFAAWAQRWFPDPFIFAAAAVVFVAAATMIHGLPALSVAKAFGDGFWSLIVFTLQQAVVAIGGYIIASSPPAARLIDRIAQYPKTGRGAVAFIAMVTMVLSLLNWAISLIFSGLLARAIARRTELRMDYRAAAAAAYLCMGATWAMGLSSSAAQLQANPGSMPPAILKITGVIPFAQTIFLWQSVVLTIVLIVTSVVVAYLSAPKGDRSVTAQMLGVDVNTKIDPLPERSLPGEWLEYSPLITILIGALGLTWIGMEFASKNAIIAISNLNTYNFLLIIVGLLLHWRPRSFLNAAAKAVPATSGIIIQFPLYGAMAAMLTAAVPSGHSLSTALAEAFVRISTTDTFPVVMGAYSAVLGFFIPSGGGKWLLEAPYVMQAANDLQVHLGWAVQVYNAAEALPNLINPFWMLPLLGVMGINARAVIGFTALQLMIHAPIVLGLLWVLSKTLTYMPPVMS